jgi:hypothetical protein
MTSWTLPHRALQIVAFLLVLVSAFSFAMGLTGALQRGGHLTGGQILSGVTGTAPADVQDATPLSADRIEGPPKVEDAPKPAGNEAAAEEDDTDQEKAPVENSAPAGNATTAPPVSEAAAGNAVEAPPPAADEPPH